MCIRDRVKAFGTRVIYSDVFRMPPEEEEKLGCEYVPFDELIASAPDGDL